LPAGNICRFIINDGPPGIGCPVIASVTGTGKVLLVIEPSISGLHDAKRLLELVESFHIPVLAVINKYDINPEITAQTEQFLQEKSIPLIGKIPFDTRWWIRNGSRKKPGGICPELRNWSGI
jgi:MinD superfamily P-loop ATPase